MSNLKWTTGIAVAVGLASPARAECLGSCLDGMVAALVSIAAYGLIGIVLLVMLIRGKWRRAGLKALGVVLVLAVAVPLFSQLWQQGRVWLVERHEIVKPLPDLATRTPLVIAPQGSCDYGACRALLLGRRDKATYVVPTEALSGLDLTGPIALKDLPLELWAFETGSASASSRVLDPTERARAAAKIDYLVLSGWSWSRAAPGEIEAALGRNPALAGIGATVKVALLLAPLDPLRPDLTLADLQPDLVDLSHTGRALALPLAPLNTQAAPNSALAAEAVGRAFCPQGAEWEVAECLDLVQP